MDSRSKRLKLRLFPWEVGSIPEYSHTLPSATTIGKVWKRKRNRSPATGDALNWVVGMYTPNADPRKVTIVWFDTEIRQGPKPRSYRPPDWYNMREFKRTVDAELQSQ